MRHVFSRFFHFLPIKVLICLYNFIFIFSAVWYFSLGSYFWELHQSCISVTEESFKGNFFSKRQFCILSNFFWLENFKVTWSLQAETTMFCLWLCQSKLSSLFSFLLYIIGIFSSSISYTASIKKWYLFESEKYFTIWS